MVGRLNARPVQESQLECDVGVIQLSGIFYLHIFYLVFSQMRDIIIAHLQTEKTRCKASIWFEHQIRASEHEIHTSARSTGWMYLYLYLHLKEEPHCREHQIHTSASSVNGLNARLQGYSRRLIHLVAPWTTPLHCPVTNTGIEELCKLGSKGWP